MNRPNDPWDALLGRYLAGQLNADDRRLLNERLRHDPAARRDFAAMLNLDSALAVAAAGTREERRARAVRNKRLTWIGTTIATALVLISALGWWMTQDDRAPFATVITSQGTEWSGPTEVRGKMQHVQSGAVGFQTATGNRVIVEGPATFRFTSAQELRLDHGRVLAMVSPEGKGFTVVTPAGKIVDYGTEFGVDVDADGSAEVQVYLGAVVVTPKRQGSHRNLTKGEALTMPGDGSPPGAVTGGRRQFFTQPETVQQLRNTMDQQVPVSATPDTPSPRTAHGDFCNLGNGAGLPGVVYDFKQDPQKQDIPFDAGRYFKKVKALGAAGFPAGEVQGYFRVPPLQRRFAYLAMPVEEADLAPWTLGAEQSMQPTGWVAHYSGVVTPPTSGEWRFVGYFDDALAVYINGQPVLDGSRDEMINAGEPHPDGELRQPFGTQAALNGKAHAGKWVALNGPTRIDIVVGERVGTQMGGLLMVENRRTAYNVRSDGSPILPPFVTRRLSTEDRAHIKAFSESRDGFQLEWQNLPVFRLDDSTPAPASSSSQ